MGNSCFRETPNITLSCVNSGMVSSCCKTGGNREKENIPLYNWIYSSCNELGCLKSNESKTSFLEFDECKDSAMLNMFQDRSSWFHLYIYESKVNSDSHLVYDRIFIKSVEGQV